MTIAMCDLEDDDVSEDYDFDDFYQSNELFTDQLFEHFKHQVALEAAAKSEHKEDSAEEKVVNLEDSFKQALLEKLDTKDYQRLENPRQNVIVFQMDPAEVSLVELLKQKHR